MPAAAVAAAGVVEAGAAAPARAAAAAAAAGAPRRCGERVFQPHRCVFLHNHRLKAHFDSPLYLLDVFFMSAQQITPHLQPVSPLSLLCIQRVFPFILIFMTWDVAGARVLRCLQAHFFLLVRSWLLRVASFLSSSSPAIFRIIVITINYYYCNVLGML